MAVRVHYFGRCFGIRRMGPFRSEVAAWAALMTVEGEPQHGATVWPERVQPTKKQAKRKS